MSVVVREVTNPSDADLDLWAKLLAEAFGYSYFSGGFAKDKSLQEPALRAHMTAALVEGDGEVHVAELPDVGVAGVTVWFGPGSKFLDSEAQRKAGWDQIIESLPAEYQEWWQGFYKEYDGLAERSLGPGVKRAGYHLQLIGVAPAHQRKGVATALMRHAEAKARALRVPSVLETAGATNIKIYQALGYSSAGSGPITLAPPATGSFDMTVFIKHTEEGA
ncbi:acyl-CoA N-acyltransferase [Trametes maxima]|nr:acyl-CoA N-acyltransferase [Trametes maxima]